MCNRSEVAGRLVDESCLEQGVSRPDGCFELSHLGLWSGDWYVRFLGCASLADALGQEEPTGQGSTEDTHLHDGVEQVLSLSDNQFLLAEQAVGQAVPVNDEQVAGFEVFQQQKLEDQQVPHAF